MEKRVEEMAAGREMDARVAREVMELYDVTFTPSGCLCHDPGRGRVVVAGMKYHLVPNYSTEMGDAWLVVEKMYAFGVGCGCRVEAYRDGDNQLAHRVDFVPFDQKGRPVVAYADTAPLAICRAALKLAAAPRSGR